ncbi:probable Bax inhibitor 1, partial [Artemia franciscana]|uniref:probable Bax inhibitor 1 n=1 Tax=Artemia franciscana TaxID=6661 RepID=UPI0032DB73F8
FVTLETDQSRHNGASFVKNMEQFKRNFNSHLEESVRKHLVNVYTTLSMSIVSCILGTYIQVLREIVTPEVGALFALVSLFGFLYVGSTKQMFGIRLSMLLVCSFSFGVSLAPVIQFVLLFNDPTIITTALVGTALIFIGFSICSILSPSGKWLFLGAPLSTYLLSVTFLRLFMGGHYALEMYIGLGVFCAYILYDTQMIIERKRTGEGDVLSHSLILFLDLVNVFVKLLRCLKEKDNKKKTK